MSRILVTGAAGFIGMHVAKRLLSRGDVVIGIDNLNSYYSVDLKRARLRQLSHEQFRFHEMDIVDAPRVARLFQDEQPEKVIHLAAQAGVRYSLVDPYVYVQSNINGFLHILEGCRQIGTTHLVYASSSSVYGANQKLPFSVSDHVDHPVSLYAASKKSNELMAHCYSHLFRLPTTGLRFFTVYGPWGRPDMACYSFTKAIVEGRPIELFNYGQMERDFTYIDDIVEGVIRVLDQQPQDANQLAPSGAPYLIYNIGNHQPIPLTQFIDLLEQALGRTAIRKLLPMQPGDVPATYADTSDLRRDTGFHPNTSIMQGITSFVEWYCKYHNVSRPGSGGCLRVSRHD